MIRLGRSFWWMLFLTGVSFLLSRLPWLSQNPIYLRLTVTLLVIIAASALWTVSSLSGVKLNRTSRETRKQVGEVHTEDYEIVNRLLLPKIWLKITDRSPLLGGTGSKVITGIGGKKTRTHIGMTLLQKRGWYELGPTQLESGDTFGLFLNRKQVESSQRLLVIPYLFDIQFFLAPFGILPGGHALREKTLEVTPYAAGVREYVPGDPLRRIHWPSSERKQMLIVKEFEKDPLAEVWIFLDARKNAHIRSDESGSSDLHQIWWGRYKKAYRLPPDTAEYSISIAASLAKYYINQKREVCLVSAGQNYSILPAERGERQLGKVLETLAVVEAEGELPIWALVSTHVNRLSRGTTVVIISPETDTRLLTIAMDLVHRGLVPVIVLIDPSGFGGVQGTTELSQKLLALGVFTFVINEGDDIKEILETPQTIITRQGFLRVGVENR